MHSDGPAAAVGQSRRFEMLPYSGREGEWRALTSCPLPVSSSLGTSSPGSSSSQASQRCLLCRPAHTGFIISSRRSISRDRLPARFRAHCRRAARVGAAAGGAEVKVARRTKASRAPRLSSSQPASRPSPLVVSEPPPTMLPSPTICARTGSFWRFDGRPSFSAAAAPAALRFAALSIAQNRCRVRYPSRNEQVSRGAARMGRVQRSASLCSTLNTLRDATLDG